MALLFALASWLAVSCARRPASLPEVEVPSSPVELPTESLTGEPRFDRARTLLAHGRLAQARAVLADELRGTSSAGRFHDRTQFLLGVLAWRLGAPKGALDHFAEISENYVDLLDYLLWYKAQALRETGELDAARASLADLLLTIPDSIWRDEAEFAIFEIDRAQNGASDALAESAADLLLSGWLDSNAFRRQPAPALLLLASTLEQAGRSRSALDLLEALLLEYPVTPQAEEAARAAKNLRAKLGLEEFEPEVEQAFKRIRALWRGGDMDAAWADTRMLLSRLRPGRAGETRTHYTEALLWKGRLYEGQGSADKAARLYRGAIENGFDDDGTFRFQLARLDARISNERAIKQHLLLVKHHPQSAKAPESLYLAARLAQLSGNNTLAHRLFERLFDEYPQSEWTPLARFNLGWIAFRQERYEQAGRAFGQIVARFPQSDEYLRALYWTGRAQDSAGDPLAAERSYRQLLSENSASYYSALAASRLGGKDPVEVLQFLSQPVPRDGQSLLTTSPPDPQTEQGLRALVSRFDGPFRPALDRATELITLGLLPQAEAELERAASANKDRPEAIAALVTLFEQAGAWRAAQRWAYRLNGERPSIVSGETRPFWQTLYPIGFAPYVLEYARRYELDPHLVLSIIREESHFDPAITSWADARGLMQIIPPTGWQIARAQQLEGFEPELLYDPEVNIRFGCYYLSSLLDRFSGNPIFAIASYNGGPHNVDKWRKKNGELELDVFVEEIPFHETRNYVKKVYRSWILYRTLYGGKTAALLPTDPSEVSLSESPGARSTARH